MITGFLFVLLGLLVLVYPQLLVAMFSAVLIVIGLGVMAVSWQFRRLRKQPESRIVNWIVRW